MSETRPIWICGTGDHCAAIGDEAPSLKGLVQDALGVPVRRVGRFIQLALIGAGRCMAGRAPNPETAVYMSSARGDLETTVEIVEGLFRQGMPPMPLSFINTVSNAPCYYVARHFDLSGRSNFICSRFFATESILNLAALDLGIGSMDSALVGSVDVTSSPIADHRRRLQLAAETPVAEGSHWMWLRAGDEPDGALAELVAAREFGDREELVQWVAEQDLPLDACRIAGGQFLAEDELSAIQQQLGVVERFEPPPPPGFYDSQSGGTLNAFVGSDGAQWLLHVNGELDGDRRTLVVVRRLS